MALRVLTFIQESFENFRLTFLACLLLRDFLTFFNFFVRLFIFGCLDNQLDTINIVSQWAWLSIAFKICDDVLLQPVFHGIETRSPHHEELKKRFITGQLVCAVCYVATAFLMLALIPAFVNRMAQFPSLADQTVEYLRLETVGLVAGSLANFSIMAMFLNEKPVSGVVCFGFQVGITAILDLVFVRKGDFSLQLGVKQRQEIQLSWSNNEKVILAVDLIAFSGLAYSSMIANTASILFAFPLGIRKFKISRKHIVTIKLQDFDWTLKRSLPGCFFSVDSVARNLTYVFVVLRSFNELQQQAVFWIAAGCINKFFLGPVLTLGKMVQMEISDTQILKTSICVGYYILILPWLVIVGLASLGLSWTLSVALGLINSDQVTSLIRSLSPGYVLCMISILFNGFLQGRNKTDCILQQTTVAIVFVWIFYDIMGQDILSTSVPNLAIMMNVTVALITVICMVQYQHVFRKTLSKQDNLTKEGAIVLT